MATADNFVQVVLPRLFGNRGGADPSHASVRRVATSTPTAKDRQSQTVPRTLRGALRGIVRRPGELRYHVIREVWSTMKRFGVDRIENIELREIAGAQDAVVETYVDDRNRGVIATVCRAAQAGTFFEIGTNRGRTAWTVARNNTDIQVYTLDLPHKDALGSTVFAQNKSDLAFFRAGWDRGEAYRDTVEAQRIETLLGDSATFDYTPYLGRMDVVLVDGAHSYEYVCSDTANALRMLSERGTILWDDYPAYAGVYQHLTDIASKFDRPLYHIIGTRLVMYTRLPIVRRLTAG
jgi:hypothetical protein